MFVCAYVFHTKNMCVFAGLDICVRFMVKLSAIQILGRNLNIKLVQISLVTRICKHIDKYWFDHVLHREHHTGLIELGHFFFVSQD